MELKTSLLHEKQRKTRHEDVACGVGWWKAYLANYCGFLSWSRKLQLHTTSLNANQRSFILCGFDGVVVLAHELGGEALLVNLEVIDEAVLAKMSNWTTRAGVYFQRRWTAAAKVQTAGQFLLPGMHVTQLAIQCWPNAYCCFGCRFRAG